MQGREQVNRRSDRHIRLLSYNIQAGTATAKYREYVVHGWKHVLPHSQRVENLDLIAGLLTDFDIVGLQEADCGSLRSGFLNQTKYLAEMAGFSYWGHQPNRRVAKLAHASNGLLSRFTPLSVEEHKLPGRIPGRGVLIARFGEKSDGLAVAIMHLALGQRARAGQLSHVGDLLAGIPNLVVMGDTNCAADSAEMAEFTRRLGLREPLDILKTYPSWRPERAIDHILVSRAFEVNSYRVVGLPVSDHLPVAMEVTLPADCCVGEPVEYQPT